MQKQLDVKHSLKFRLRQRTGNNVTEIPVEGTYSVFSKRANRAAPFRARSRKAYKRGCPFFSTQKFRRVSKRKKCRNPTPGVQLFSNLANVVAPLARFAGGIGSGVGFTFFCTKFWRARRSGTGARDPSSPVLHEAMSRPAAGRPSRSSKRRRFSNEVEDSPVLSCA